MTIFNLSIIGLSKIEYIFTFIILVIVMSTLFLFDIYYMILWCFYLGACETHLLIFIMNRYSLHRRKKLFNVKIFTQGLNPA
jgi:hypothetical protein